MSLLHKNTTKNMKPNVSLFCYSFLGVGEFFLTNVSQNIVKVMPQDQYASSSKNSTIEAPRWHYSIST